MSSSQRPSSAELPLRCWVEIDGSALRHNLREIRRRLAPATQAMAVVKANAYGHGLVAFAREAEASGIDWLGVAHVREGIELRRGGIRRPILLLSACLPEEFAAAIRWQLTPTISTLAEARHYHRATGRKTVEAHFKIDTGMGRLGAWVETAHPLLAQIERLPRLKITGLYTHFASADSDAPLTRRQWRAFQALRDRFPGKMVHAANSPGLCADSRYALDCVRVGLMLYGVGPESVSRRLRPVLTWKSRITLVKVVPAGRTVSYGAAYRLARPEVHAIVAAGYGDGYFRALTDGGEVLIHGQRCPIRGRVTMDQIIVDVSHVRQPRAGQEVVLLGRQKRETITTTELAARARTIGYEILTNVSARVARVYVHFRSGK